MKNLTRGQRFLTYVYGVLFVGMTLTNVVATVQRDTAIRNRDLAISARLQTADPARVVILPSSLPIRWS